MKYLSKPLLASMLGLVLFSGVSLATATESTATTTVNKPETERHLKKPEMKKLDITCVQTAVEKREAAVAASVDTYYSALKTALSVRRDALKTAWAITDNKARSTAVNAAWKTFQDSRKAAQKIYRDSRNAAWKTFSTDRKACGLSSSAEEGVGRSNDLNL